MRIPQAFSTGPIGDVVAEATGREARHDPVLSGTGGPAGNAVLTAWTGIVLLVLGVAELLTLFDVRGLISWHVALGALLVPPALLKVGSTGWRLVRYYLGHEPYVDAGPPVLLLRLLGPLVVISTLGLLATGVLLILLGQAAGRGELVTVLGFRIDWITLHQGAFLVWAAATGLHLLARIVPAIRLTFVQRRGRRVPGRPLRIAALGLALLVAAVLAVTLVNVDGSWAGDGSPEASRSATHARFCASGSTATTGPCQRNELARTPAPEGVWKRRNAWSRHCVGEPRPAASAPESWRPLRCGTRITP